MKLHHFTLLTASLFSAALMAQGEGENLIKNGGFEELTKPVKTWDQLDHAAGWYNANNASADLFSKDARCNTVGIPDGEMGTGASAFEGAHFAGFLAYKDDQRRNWKRFLGGTEDAFRPAFQMYSEYVETALGAPLTAGQKYDVSFRVKLANGSDRAVSGIGALLSPLELKYKNSQYLQEKPQVSTTKIVDNKQEWTEVTGTFTADGNEKYLVIGAFINGGFETAKVIVGADNQRAYYYLDGVSLTLHPEDDRDHDGIADKDDLCPDVFGLAQFQGCPDTDGDGVPDHLDKCPNVAGPVAFEGCPDTDGDGVPDHLDRCPTVKGLASNNGCPEITEKAKKLFEKALTGIQFDTGKSSIKSSSNSILNQVVEVMNENPSYHLEIHGYTDSQGDDAKNLALSVERAAAVRTYLVNKGTAADRMESFGHGEADPVADNTTASGRAQNRRVEFKVTFLK